ncbi:OmpA family protein [Pikeienuella piscinae]|uniref:OmpA family protein n=1 Tax=Pikeienuella piscinae TaxID=2748098 RepID=A0A7M3T5E6_9RHOB|nr:OmpA family protein [Pikeienuella piscinae]QIE57227.1 OmpA family protein [Pikeienuella piscinae]
MRLPLSIPVSGLAMLAFLVGCASEAGRTPGATSFGAAQHNNAIAQSAALRQAGYVEEERARFMAAAPDTVYFAFNRAALAPPARAALAAQAAWLIAHPDVRVRISGHADLIGGERYNQGLGLTRARAAARVLIDRGVAPGRIDAVESEGENAPIVPSETPERLNRRAVTEITGLMRGYVGDGLDGERANLMYGRYASDTVEPPASANTTTVSASGGG